MTLISLALSWKAKGGEIKIWNALEWQVSEYHKYGPVIKAFVLLKEEEKKKKKRQKGRYLCVH